jgi:hypothetical protein
MTPLCEQWVNLGKGTGLVLKRLGSNPFSGRRDAIDQIVSLTSCAIFRMLTSNRSNEHWDRARNWDVFINSRFPISKKANLPEIEFSNYTETTG